MYDLSDSVPIAVDVHDSTGNLTDAGTVTLTITLPDGTSITPTVANPPASTGQYRYTYVPDQVGRHTWRFVATTPNTAYQDVFEVRDTESPALLSVADAKAHLNVTTTLHDDELREYLEAATEVVEQYIGPVIRRSHTARVCGGTARIALPHTQVLEVTSVTMVSDGSSVPVADLAVYAASGVAAYKDGSVFPVGDMDWTYTVGRSLVKANWTMAAKIIVKHMWETQLGNLPSIQGDSPGYVVTGNGYLVPFRAVSLLTRDDVPVGFA